MQECLVLYIQHAVQEFGVCEIFIFWRVVVEIHTLKTFVDKRERSQISPSVCMRLNNNSCGDIICVTATFTEDLWFGKEGGAALNFSTWVHPFSSWQMDFLWQSKDPISKNTSSLKMCFKLPLGQRRYKIILSSYMLPKVVQPGKSFPQKQQLSARESHTTWVT